MVVTWLERALSLLYTIANRFNLSMFFSLFTLTFLSFCLFLPLPSLIPFCTLPVSTTATTITNNNNNNRVLSYTQQSCRVCCLIKSFVSFLFLFFGLASILFSSNSADESQQSRLPLVRLARNYTFSSLSVYFFLFGLHFSYDIHTRCGAAAFMLLLIGVFLRSSSVSCMLADHVVE